MTSANFSLKEEIRLYWSKRAATFDDSFGHRIPPGPEAEAWAAVICGHLGPEPQKVLELASGTGEVTNVLLGLGHTVTGLDFSETMLARSRQKHRGAARARFVLGDAEDTREDAASYDAVVCRHLVWTLTDPEAALRDWQRVLKPGGKLLVFDGDFVNPPLAGRLARQASALIERWGGGAPHRDPSLAAEHEAILAALPFNQGLSFERLRALAQAAGFVSVQAGRYAPILSAQRKIAKNWPQWLQTFGYRRFILDATRA